MSPRCVVKPGQMLRLSVALSMGIFGGSRLNQMAVLLEINSDDTRGSSHEVIDRLVLGSWVEVTF
jgi:hypothetical protein